MEFVIGVGITVRLQMAWIFGCAAALGLAWLLHSLWEDWRKSVDEAWRRQARGETYESITRERGE
jgi:hypothetical protein